MNFDEAISWLREQEGKYVDVSITIPPTGAHREQHLAAFAGQVERVKPSAFPLDEAWYVWMKRDDGLPRAASIRLNPELFEAADVHADPAGPPEERHEYGMTWTFQVRQRGVVTQVTVYV